MEEVKAHLASTKLEEYQYGTAVYKLLDGEAKEAVRHLDVDKDLKNKLGAEKVIFDALEDRFPDLEEPDQRTEAMTELITFKPKHDEKPGAVAGRFTQVLRKVSKQKMNMGDEMQGWFLLWRLGLDENQVSNILNNTGGSYSLKAVKLALRKLWPSAIPRRAKGAYLTQLDAEVSDVGVAETPGMSSKGTAKELVTSTEPLLLVPRSTPTTRFFVSLATRV